MLLLISRSHPPCAALSSSSSSHDVHVSAGLAFGTGSAIAHRAVGAVAGAMFGGSDDKEKVADAAAPAAAAAPAPAGGAGKADDCAPFQRDFIRCVQEVRPTLSLLRSLARSLAAWSLILPR